MNRVTVQFLGCGDTFGGGGRFQTWFCVRAIAARFLLDCGASSPVAMRRFAGDARCINAILLTHPQPAERSGLKAPGVPDVAALA